ncbi:C4-type zinc ribbon domain-containing protein [Rathayibacter sp. YIM 133350]|uniref:zinc ribbon domain-containing protein n=1 Tax=Rathayibacter sp. YIM 133350 TaxID=3131992 RepID=UPI00307CDEBD
MKARPDEQQQLLRLQDVDSRLNRLSHQLSHLPQSAELAALGARSDEVRRRLNAAAGSLDDAQVELSRLESDVAVVEARMKRDTDRLQHTSSTKDVQALEAELASLAKRQGDLEEIELTVMERVEEREQAVAAIQAEQAELADAASVLEQERDREREKLGTQQREAERDREAVASAVSEELRALYEKRRAVGGGVGAALLRARTCSGCTMTLTGVDLETVRTAPADEVLFCPDCGRILIRTEESGI